jgi:hypothetical protein
MDSSRSPESPERLKATAEGVAGQAAELARQQAEGVYRRGSESASIAARSGADALDETANRLSAEGQESLAQAASYMSHRLSDLASQLEHPNLDDLMQQARRLARDNPALFVGGGVVVGLALSRFFRASEPVYTKASRTDTSPEPFEDRASADPADAAAVMPPPMSSGAKPVTSSVPDSDTGGHGHG